MELSPQKKQTLDSLVSDLKSIENIAALVLGGSHCTGMATEQSDLDIGIYYHESSPFDIDQVRRVAEKYNIEEGLTVTNFYQWGAWVNGGAWISTATGEVDFVYRNIQQVKATIEKAKDGIVTNDFEQQPPYGFSSVIYLAETHYCIPLYDPNKIIHDLKMEVRNYPPNLKQSLVQQSLWSAEFTLWQAKKFATKQDVYNTAGCLTRATKNIVDALFALNEIYPIGDKQSLQILENASIRPEQLSSRIEAALSVTKNNLTDKVNELRSLFEQVAALTKGAYQAYFKL